MTLKPILQRLVPFAVLLFIVCSGVWYMSRSASPAGRRGLGDSFTFDGDQHLQTDQDLLMATEQEPIPIHLENPLNFCMGADNRAYVVGDGKLVTIESNGATGSLALTFQGSPRCVAVSTNGTIYVGIDDHVETFSATGEPLATWPVPAAGARLSDIAVSEDYAFVTDVQHKTLYRYRLDGEILETHRGFTLFSSPVLSVATSREGTFWVANPGERELRHYKGDGRLLTKWSREGRDPSGFSGCCNPVSVAVLDDGNLLVSEKHILRVKVVRPDGSLVGVVAGPEAFDPKTPHLNVAVDKIGRMLVLDPVRRQIRVFERKTEDRRL